MGWCICYIFRCPNCWSILLLERGDGIGGHLHQARQLHPPYILRTYFGRQQCTSKSNTTTTAHHPPFRSQDSGEGDALDRTAAVPIVWRSAHAWRFDSGSYRFLGREQQARRVIDSICCPIEPCMLTIIIIYYFSAWPCGRDG